LANKNLTQWSGVWAA